MVDRKRPKLVTTPPRNTDLHLSPRKPDPGTGEVRAGPGDSGLADRPEINARRTAKKPMSNRRLAIGLGIAALLTVFTLSLRALF